MIATLGGTFLGAEDRRHDLVGRIDGRRVGVRVDVKAVFVDGEAVGVFALYENHADRSGCHRHAKYGVHFSSKAARSLAGCVKTGYHAGPCMGIAGVPSSVGESDADRLPGIRHYDTTDGRTQRLSVDRRIADTHQRPWPPWPQPPPP